MEKKKIATEKPSERPGVQGRSRQLYLRDNVLSEAGDHV